MENSYLKLYAKNRMVKNYFRCFFVSIFPPVTILSLSLLNYYLFILLRQTNFSFNPYISQYAEVIRVFLLTVNVIISLFIWQCVCLLKNNFFFKKVKSSKLSFFKASRSVTFRQCITFFAVSILRFLLGVSWSTVYLSPCLAVSILLIYCYRYENYGYNVNLTLFVSAVGLLIIGISFLYMTLKRYAMCTYIILKDKMKNPLKVIEKSLDAMEGKSVRYGIYCLSFMGWIMLCLLIVPSFYVAPYFSLGKWFFLSSLSMKEKTVEKCDKPIIFYIKSQKKVGS